MSKADYPLKLPASLMTAAERLAKQAGISLDQWIAVAVEEKINAVTAQHGVFSEWHSEADKQAYRAFAKPE